MGEILNIPFGVPFLETLRDLISEKCGGDRTQIAKAKIFLPSQRSCRELRNVYMDKLPEGGAVLLPRIHALGEADTSDFVSDDISDLRQALQEMPSVMPEFTARITAKKLLDEIYEKHFKKSPAPDLGGAVSYSLVSFLEEFETYEADYSGFGNLFDADISEHWQRLSSFIMDFTSSWQEMLDEKGLITAAKQRKLLMNFLADSWQKSPPAFHVFAAGSTGSIPSTARFLKAVASLPNGKVIIEGLDKPESEDVWKSLGRSHFQYGLKNLIEVLGVDQETIKNFVPESKSAKLASQIFMPANFFSSQKVENSHSNIHRIDADNLRQEAMIISLLMREVLEEENKTAALVTHNRSLARQVAANLKRFDLSVDDTAGAPLLKTANGNFLMLLSTYIADFLSGNFAPELFLSLLKHPLFEWGAGSAVEVRNIARSIEADFFRNIKCPQSFEELILVASAKGLAGGFLREFSKIVSKHFTPQRLADFSKLLKSQIDLATLFSGGKIFEKDEGENLKQHLESLLQQSDGMLDISPIYFAEYLEAFLQDKVFRPRYGGHPRLKILSPIEARLLSFDRVILGGLNDGSWPHLSTPNPWASEFMREKLGIPTIENRTGQSAHDFAAHICQSEVFLTRAEKEGGSPANVSRFLARVSALRGESSEEKIIAAKWKALAESINKPEAVKASSEPRPNPDAQNRPHNIRVTELETLVRDPYEFYAKNILGLKPLDEISPEPDGSNFGTIVHKVLKRFSDNYDYIAADKRESFIYEEALCELKAGKFPHKAYVLWLPRIRNIAEWIVENENEIRPHLAKVLSEVSGKWSMSTGGKDIEIKGRADRLEIYKDGNEAMVDYKTSSTIPTKVEVESGVASQLYAMAVMASNGGFEGFGANISAAEYWQITGRKHEKGKTAEYSLNKAEFAVAEEGIRKLLDAFLAKETPFAVSPIESLRKKYSDYEHLERCDEWE